MYKKILVGIAFHNEEQSRKAIDLANLLRDEGGTVTLLHVVEDIPGYAVNQIPEGIIEETRDVAEGSLRKLAKGVSPAVETLVVAGHSGRTVVSHANANGFDCIVIASHRPELSDYLLGSTASQVARHANCSVHILR